MGQIYVKVRDKSVDDYGDPTLNNGIETVITYKAYGYTQDKFELLYQCDERGNQVLGSNGEPNPNLNAQHRQIAQVKNADPVVNAGPSAKELALLAEVERLRSQLSSQNQQPFQAKEPEVVQQVPDKIQEPIKPAGAKRGPKPKQQLQEIVA